MVVRIRLARFGKRNSPFYNIVVAQAKSGRNSKPMEVLGIYDPVPKDPVPGLYPYASPPPDLSSQSVTASSPSKGTSSSSSSSAAAAAAAPAPARKYKDVRLDTARTRYWLGVGAQPSEPVWKLLSMVGLVERPFREDELRARAREADERHREYWASRGLGPDGVSPLAKAPAGVDAQGVA